MPNKHSSINPQKKFRRKSLYAMQVVASQDQPRDIVPRFCIVKVDAQLILDVLSKKLEFSLN